MQGRTKGFGTLVFSVLLFGLMLFLAFHHHTVQYLVKMGVSQSSILFGSVPVKDYVFSKNADIRVRENLSRIEDIKRFSVNVLGFKPTSHYTRIFPDEGKTLLWVLSASNAYEINAYRWSFPLLGQLSYKGYFDLEDAEKEKKGLLLLGYDVDMAPVSAWSSLGYWPEPLLEKHLFKNKADFCALLFHELFHTTYYKAGAVNLNENLADFAAEKACLIYLKRDHKTLQQFLDKQQSTRKISEFMLEQAKALNQYYDTIRQRPDRAILKQARFEKLAEVIRHLGYLDENQKKRLLTDLRLHKNAAFVGYQQYRGLYDSLNFAFNNFYGGQIKKMVRSLKQDD